MFNKQKQFNVKMKGFTLIELMIVVAIVGILSAIANASYRNYIVRSSRGDAMEKLNEIMSQQQRYVLRQRTYTQALNQLGYPQITVTTDNNLYNIAAGQCTQGGALVPITRCVLLTATPLPNSRQANDGTLTLDSNRQKTQNGRVGWYQQN